MNGNEMRAIRKKLAMTQYQLAQKLDVSRQTLLGWEASEDDLDEGIALQVRKAAGQVRLIENTYWVQATDYGTYAVARRHILGGGMQVNGVTALYGEFKNRAHAYRWCTALQNTADPRATKTLSRERAEEQAAREAASQK